MNMQTPAELIAELTQATAEFRRGPATHAHVEACLAAYAQMRAAAMAADAKIKAAEIVTEGP